MVLSTLLVVATIILLEVVLSIDNSAVLAVIVNKDLPPNQRAKALRYGMWGAFVFRGLALFATGWILNNPTVGIVFKVLGGLYLIRLGYKGLTPKKDSIEEGDVSWYEKTFKKLGLSTFWTTVLICEAVDIIFSLDNLVAVIGMSRNIWVVIISVIVGIAIMRLIATRFSKLLDKYPFLERSAFIVVLLLGLKLVTLGISEYTIPSLHHIMENHNFDFAFSGVMMLIFFVPLILTRARKLTPVVSINKPLKRDIIPDAFFNTKTAHTAYYNPEMGFYYTKEEPGEAHSLWGLERSTEWKKLNL